MHTRLYLITLFSFVISHEYFEDRKIIRYNSPLSAIPKRFDVKGEDADKQFQKYVLEINNIAQRQNMTVRYRVKVDTFKPNTHRFKKTKQQKSRSKKYMVPLKRKSMKPSSRELLQRRLAEMKEAKTERIILTTQKKPIIYTTKVPHSGKYRPIINGVKTNYSKNIRPVKSKIVTLG